MFARSMKLVRAGSITAAAAALMMVASTGTALAIDKVPCTPGAGFLKIWSHLGGQTSVDCYANAGKRGFGGWWVDKVSTGNNDVWLFDRNGDIVPINRWTEITYPNRPPQIDAIQIR